MLNRSLITLGKTISGVSRALNRGNGSTWPGHIALKGNKNFIREVLNNSKTKTIIVAGTNGKTTTSSLIQTGLEKNGKSVIQNRSGANLLNGIASTLIMHSDSMEKIMQDYAVFEVDENALPLVLKQLSPDYLVLLNLFRDQLDRYGEINTILQKWQDAIKELPEKTKLVLNADDPQIATIPVFLKIPEQRILYFGIQDKKNAWSQLHHAADSVSCPRCGERLHFTQVSFSHLGNWECPNCGLKRPRYEQKSLTYPLTGIYNKYNTNAALLVLKDLGLTEKQISFAFQNFKPAFGRQELIEYKRKKVQLFLSKNPTSFTQSYMTIHEFKASTLLIVLNDRIPDGRDVSWIWDIDLPEIEKFDHILLSGDRVYDMALRIKYTDYKRFKTFGKLNEAIDEGISLTKKDETLFILPTYSAMLDVRKIVTGKKIL